MIIHHLNQSITTDHVFNHTFNRHYQILNDGSLRQHHVQK